MVRRLLFSALVGVLSAASLGALSFTTSVGGSFTDISTSGTALGLTDDGEANIAMTISNAVFAAGSIRVGNNGGVGFGLAAGDLSFSNVALPGTGGLSGLFGASPAKQTLLPYWDDIDADTGNVYWQESGGVLIVQWNDRPHFSNSADHATFQLKVFNTGGPAYAQFIYSSIGTSSFLGGASATVGYTDGTSGANGGSNLQWSFNTAGAVADGMVVSLVDVVPEPASLAALSLGLLFLKRRKK